jgi:hypothetical protein
MAGQCGKTVSCHRLGNRCEGLDFVGSFDEPAAGLGLDAGLVGCFVVSAVAGSAVEGVQIVAEQH